MLFAPIRKRLVGNGYSENSADAKIAHDVILAAIEASGFHDTLTVKGGVVMSGITNLVRRATMDMDVDFLHYSLGETSIRRFVSRLNRNSDCTISIEGSIIELKQQEYKGKRVFLAVKDESGAVVRTKVDVGVHTREEVAQRDFGFKVVTEDGTVKLLVNTNEQIFVEKLKSLLRIGYVSTRLKDVYDMFYLVSRLRKRMLKEYMRIYIHEDPHMPETNVAMVSDRMKRIFSNRTFVRRLSNPNYAWIDAPVADVTKSLLAFVSVL